jgi:hypothetical protein
MVRVVGDRDVMSTYSLNPNFLEKSSHCFGASHDFPTGVKNRRRLGRAGLLVVPLP